MKVLLSADQPGRKSARAAAAPKATAVLIQTKPFKGSYLVKRLVGMVGAAAGIYWIGRDRFQSWAEQGEVGISWLGIGLLAFAVVVLCLAATQCWKYFDPYPELRITPGTAQLGGSFDVEWTFSGAKGRLKMIAMALEGREEVWAENKATKQARPQKLTAPFYLDQLQMPQRLDHGHVHVQLPGGLMPTLETEKTKIVWLVRFENQIKWGPRIRYEFPVQVTPVQAAREGANG